MKIRQITGNLFKLAVLCACIYAVLNWQAISSSDGEIEKFAENACVDEIGARYNVSRVRAYDVAKTANGYTVRASATSARGTTIKVVCVTNAHGGVRDMTIDER